MPQGHKVALVDLAAGDAVLRYNVVIGRAARAIAAGSWVHERLLEMPRGALARRAADRDREAAQPLPSRSRATPSRATATPTARSAPATSWRSRPPCSAWPASSTSRSQRIKGELLPKYPNVDDVVGLEHTYGCGVAIDAPDAVVPIRTLRNITLNPNFGNEVMVVSLGCEKLQPERLLPPGTLHDRRRAQRRRRRHDRRGASSTSCACRTRRTSASCR